jgi:hypothetical protein
VHMGRVAGGCDGLHQLAAGRGWALMPSMLAHLVDWLLEHLHAPDFVCRLQHRQLNGVPNGHTALHRQ